MNSLPAYQYIDPDLLLDKYHPANSPFFKSQRSIQCAIVAQTTRLRMRHVEIAKLYIKGIPNKDIAERLNVAVMTVHTVLKRPEVVLMVELLQHYAMHMDGPSIEHRKRILYEIAYDNQTADPKTSISAIREMNSMDGVGKDKQDSKIEITINNQQLGRGVLDSG